MNNLQIKQAFFLAKHSIKKSHTNSVFGLFWAVFLPLVQSITFYYFFVEGMRFTGTVQGHPLIMFLITGNLAWTICITILTNGPMFIQKHSDLIKNIRISFLTVVMVEVMALLIIHVFVMIMVSFLLYGMGYEVHLSYINFLFFWFVFFVYATALSYILSLVTILIKDIKHLLASIMVPLFWMTPVLWEPEGIMMTFQKLINPVYFFIHGYRYTILENEYFWEHNKYNLYFLIVTIIMIFICIVVEKSIGKKTYDLI